MIVSALLISCIVPLAGPPAELFAVGSEPFWTLEVDARASEIRLDRAGEPGLVFPSVQASPAAGSIASAKRYFARSADDRHRLAITVSEVVCTDLSTGNRYPQTVALELNGVLRTGCGRLRP